MGFTMRVLLIFLIFLLLLGLVSAQSMEFDTEFEPDRSIFSSAYRFFVDEPLLKWTSRFSLGSNEISYRSIYAPVQPALHYYKKWIVSTFGNTDLVTILDKELKVYSLYYGLESWDKKRVIFPPESGSLMGETLSAVVSTKSNEKKSGKYLSDLRFCKSRCEKSLKIDLSACNSVFSLDVISYMQARDVFLQRIKQHQDQQGMSVPRYRQVHVPREVKRFTRRIRFFAYAVPDRIKPSCQGAIKNLYRGVRSDIAVFDSFGYLEGDLADSYDSLLEHMRHAYRHGAGHSGIGLYQTAQNDFEELMIDYSSFDPFNN